jgi:adenylate cyclase
MIRLDYANSDIIKNSQMGGAMARVSVMICDKPGHSYNFDNTMSVGRDSCNDIQILDQKVSRRHLVIEKCKGFFIVKDLGSRNGTFINEVRISECELKSGDRINLGNTELLFTDEPLSGIDEVRSKTGKDEGSPSGSESLILQYNFRSLKEASFRLKQVNQKESLIDSLSQIVSYSGRFCPIDSGSVLFQDTQDILHKLFMIDRSYILLHQKDTHELKLEAFRMTHSTDHQPVFSNAIFKKVYIEGLSMLSENCFSDGNESDGTDDVLNNCCAMCAPIRSGTNILGMLYVDSSSPGKFTESDLMLLSALGLIAGTNINSWFSFRRAQARALSSLISLAMINETNKQGVSGKTARLAFRTFALCENMGLPDDQIDIITAAAVLASFLDKDDTNPVLTETRPEDVDDFEITSRENLIDSHINQFPAMADILRLLRNRKENYDGSGFPHGKRGNAIPLGSRILRALFVLETLNDTVPEISKNLSKMSGTVLDPIVVKALARLTCNITEFGKIPELFRRAQDDTDS